MRKHAYSASQRLGWRLDAGFSIGEGIRAVEFTPLGSACSVSFGTGITPGLELVVNDIDAAWVELAGRGAEVSGIPPRPGAGFFVSARIL